MAYNQNQAFIDALVRQWANAEFFEDGYVGSLQRALQVMCEAYQKQRHELATHPTPAKEEKKDE